MDDELTHKYAANISQLAAKARSVIRDLDPQVTHSAQTEDGHIRAPAVWPLCCRPLAVQATPMMDCRRRERLSSAFESTRLNLCAAAYVRGMYVSLVVSWSLRAERSDVPPHPQQEA